MKQVLYADGDLERVVVFCDVFLRRARGNYLTVAYGARDAIDKLVESRDLDLVVTATEFFGERQGGQEVLEAAREYHISAKVVRLEDRFAPVNGYDSTIRMPLTEKAIITLFRGYL